MYVVFHNASCPPSFNKAFSIGESLLLKRLYFGTVNRQTIKEFMQIKAKTITKIEEFCSERENVERLPSSGAVCSTQVILD